jgi:DNA topoisomerase-3
LRFWPKNLLSHETLPVSSEPTSGARAISRNGYVVTWAIGHLVSLAQPHEINPEWREWRFDLLPILPGHWPLVIFERTKDQFEVVRKILTSSRCRGLCVQRTPGGKGN